MRTRPNGHTRRASFRSPALALAAGVLALASACGRPPIEILWPPRGALLTFMPLPIHIEFARNADPASLQVVLNGHDITASFEFEESPDARTIARARGIGAPALQLAANLLVATFEMANSQQRSWLTPFDTTGGDAFADSVPAWSIGANGGFNSDLLPDVVTGPPAGQGLFNGGLDVVSLGSAGWIELAFDDNAIVDGPGDDLIVFENPFLELDGQFITGPPFAEPGRVLVSQDGITWHAFPCALVEQPQPLQAPYYPGCAGVYPVLSDAEEPHPSEQTSLPIEDLVGQYALEMEVPAGAGGDAFDLADLGLAWARYVRIEGADFSGGASGSDNFGFDLDALSAIHSVPADDSNGDGVPDAVP